MHPNSVNNGMRVAARFNAKLMDHIRNFVSEGQKTQAIDAEIFAFTIKCGHRPSTLNYLGYPWSCCISVNDVVCHGLPSDYKLQSGDIVNVDISTLVNGWHADQSETFLVGDVCDEARMLVQCAFDCLWDAIKAIKPSCPVFAIGEAIERKISQTTFSIVRDYCGHGIGSELHQRPTIPHFKASGSKRIALRPGCSFTIEPMINLGRNDCLVDANDGWTVRTRDGKLSAQFEHTILMTELGPEVITQTEFGPQLGHIF